MKIQQTRTQKLKAGVHCAQAGFIVIGGILTLVVLTKPGGLGGSVGFFFGLCFLSIPAIIYQTMVPMWSRAWRFANVYAYAVLDILFTILWFAAFIAVAVWTNDGMKKGKNNGAKEEDSKKGNAGGGTCAAFAYGSASKCETAKATIGFGVIIWLLFGATSYLSIRAVFNYKRTGVVSNVNSDEHGKVEMLDPGRDDWSANTDELDRRQSLSAENFNGENDPRKAYGQLSDDETEHSLLRPEPSLPGNPFQDTDDGVSQAADHNDHIDHHFNYQRSSDVLDTEAATLNQQERPRHQSSMSSIGSYNQSTTHDEHGPTQTAHFPPANYERVTDV